MNIFRSINWIAVVTGFFIGLMAMTSAAFIFTDFIVGAR